MIYKNWEPVLRNSGKGFLLAKDKFLVTSTIRFLRENQVDFIERPYKYGG